VVCAKLYVVEYTCSDVVGSFKMDALSLLTRSLFVGGGSMSGLSIGALDFRPPPIGSSTVRTEMEERGNFSCGSG